MTGGEFVALGFALYALVPMFLVVLLVLVLVCLGLIWLIEAVAHKLKDKNT
jgi:hypothetical protein